MTSYSVRSIFRHGPVYEERLVLHEASDFDEALIHAQAECEEYARNLGDCEFLGLLQAFEIGRDELVDGAELFSLLRKSDLAADDYLSRFFDTGNEVQSHSEDE